MCTYYSFIMFLNGSISELPSSRIIARAAATLPRLVLVFRGGSSSDDVAELLLALSLPLLSLETKPYDLF